MDLIYKYPTIPISLKIINMLYFYLEKSISFPLINAKQNLVLKYSSSMAFYSLDILSCIREAAKTF